MKKLPIALQLWSVRDDCARDFAATAAAVAQMGYAGIELAGYGNLDAKGVRAAADAAGLVVSGMHVGREALHADLGRVTDEAFTLGTTDVICPWWPDTQYVSPAACEEIGRQLNAIGATLRSFGLRFSFHNHHGELQNVGGRTVFDWMLRAAEPRNLAAEVDVYWVNFAGVSPSAFLRSLGARCPLVHLKDGSELGQGPVDFSEVFAAIDSVGAAEWLVVEVEQSTRSPLEAVRLSFDQLKKWGRA
jgi:sugar phosphate isomerase/epimerase